MFTVYYVNSGSDTSEDGATTTKRQRKCDPNQWKKCRVQEVTALPEGIDGLTVYEMKTAK